MTNKESLWDAIEARDLNAVAESIASNQAWNEQHGLCTCGKLTEPLAVFHGIGCGYRMQYASEVRKMAREIAEAQK